MLVALIAQASCIDATHCPGCPAPSADILIVLGTGSAAATVTGPQGSGAMFCLGLQGRSTCAWPTSVPFASGTYSLDVAAAGFEPMTVSATLDVGQAGDCGCVGATLTPSPLLLRRDHAGDRQSHGRLRVHALVQRRGALLGVRHDEQLAPAVAQIDAQPPAPSVAEHIEQR